MLSTKNTPKERFLILNLTRIEYSEYFVILAIHRTEIALNGKNGLLIIERYLSSYGLFLIYIYDILHLLDMGKDITNYAFIMKDATDVLLNCLSKMSK